MNEQFGQGFVTLDALHAMPADEYGAWLAFYAEWYGPTATAARARREEVRKAEEQHDEAMRQAKHHLSAYR